MSIGAFVFVFVFAFVFAFVFVGLFRFLVFFFFFFFFFLINALVLDIFHMPERKIKEVSRPNVLSWKVSQCPLWKNQMKNYMVSKSGISDQPHSD